MAKLPEALPPVNDSTARRPNYREDLLTLDALAAALAEVLAALPASRDLERAQTLARLLEAEAARQLAALDAASTA